MQAKRLALLGKFSALVLFGSLFWIHPAAASGLSCSDIDGASIFGYDYSEYVYLGSISNPYGSNSIANEYGTYGSEYSSYSIFNEYGTHGGEYGTYSAFNDYASRPPILINDDYEIIGYITTNDYLWPSINPYIARACADDSFRFPTYEHEDITFESESDLAGYASSSTSYLSIDDLCQAQYGIYSYGVGTDSCACLDGYEWNNSRTACESPSISCPTNATEVAGACYCNSGYLYSEELGYCIDYDTSCTASYGDHTYGDANYCYCDDGYKWNAGKTACEKQEEVSENSTEPTPGQYEPDKFDATLVAKTSGYILLQVEQHGEAWYMNPQDGLRYYMEDGDVAYQMMRKLSLGITDADLEKIPDVADTDEMDITSSVCSSNTSANRLKGYILLQVEQHGEAWYVDPDKCRRIYMKDGDVAYSLMRYLSLGITDTDLTKLPTGEIE